MKALILAAGLGKRLGLEDIPKPMYKINGIPIIEHNLLLLKKHNIKDICITLHHKGEAITNYLNNGSRLGLNICYSIEKTLLGTSGALRNVEWFLDSNPFFVIYSDNYTLIDLTSMLKIHKESNTIATIALFDPKKSPNSGIAGGVITLDKGNNLLSFIEGNENGISGYVNAGVYILEPGILEAIPTDKPSDFGKDIFPKLINEGYTIKGYITDSFVFAIDTIDALKATEEIIRRDLK